jgi:uncharacterized protein
VIRRPVHESNLLKLIRDNRVVGLVGARQVGKTTLAKLVAAKSGKPTLAYDMEDDRDRALLADPMLALQNTAGLVIVDEVQLSPNLFRTLRVLVDRPRGPRFLVLGSASGDLLRQGSETLAGRIAWYELPSLGIDEVGADKAEALWLRGGFPLSFTARSLATSGQWRRDFVKTFLERDLGKLELGVAPSTMSRFWSMLAHWHGQTMNWSELGRSLDVSDSTIRKYLDVLEHTFMVRQLKPWYENLAKRQVKAPKAYIRDSGLLHSLLSIGNKEDLVKHPKVGASWEGFCVEELVRHLGARSDECFFWGTHGGAELDLLLVRGQQRRGFEIKRTSSPAMTKSITSALVDLQLSYIDVIYPGDRTFPLSPQVRAVALRDLNDVVTPLRGP